MASNHLNDDILGEFIIETWGGCIRYLYQSWYIYDDGVWLPLSKEQVDAYIWGALSHWKPLGAKPSEQKVKSINGFLAARLAVPKGLGDQGETYINLKNGLLNLETLELEAHNPHLFLSSQLGIAYDPDATAPRWQQFLRESLVTVNGQTDQGLIDLLKEAFGYSLTAETRYEKAFLLVGAAGSGKSTIINVLMEISGSSGMAADLSALGKDKVLLAELPGKRVLASTEAQAGVRLADNVIKAVVSGDMLSARSLYKYPFNFRPQAKIWWAMNELPENRDRSEGVYRRLVIIPFRQSIPESKRDPHLIETLRAELPGILNWALDGLARLQQRGHFELPQSAYEEVATYREDNDPVAQFLADEEWCELLSTGRVQARDLYFAYVGWAAQYGYPDISERALARQWDRLGLHKVKQGVNYYHGVRLTVTAEDVAKKMMESSTRRR